MSVDLVAILRTPVALAAVIDSGRRILTDLLANTAVPDPEVFVEHRYQRGVRTDPGRRLCTAKLVSSVIGSSLATDDTGGGRFCPL